jgi:23S rRNA pseudouridine1911/1915/1917 synthase
MSTSPEISYTASAGDDGQRLDVFLAAALDISRSRVAALLKDGLVSGGSGKKLKASYPVAGGETFTLPRPEQSPRSNTLVPEDIPLDIVYEDNSVLVINKPAGMVVHPAPGHRTGTLANAVSSHISESDDERFDPLRPGIIHRLDKATSGLLVVARTFDAHRKLQADLKERKISRIYLAITLGHWHETQGTLDAPLGRSTRDRKKITVSESGREATTDYTVLESFIPAELLEVRLRTGRTHQIRVHFAHGGHPVLGDPDYGGREGALKGHDPRHWEILKQALDLIPRQALHAHRLAFNHPVSGEKLDFTAPPPQDFRAVLELLRDHAGFNRVSGEES